MKRLMLLPLLLLLASFVQADSLTTDQANRWLDSMASLEVWSDAHPQNAEMLRQKASHQSNSAIPSFSQTITAVRGTAVESQITDLLAKHGFTGLEQWGWIGDKVMSAYMALSAQGQDMNGQMMAQMEQLKNDPNIPEAQKQAMMQSMQQIAQMMQMQSNAPASDIEAVKPLQARFEQMGE